MVVVWACFLGRLLFYSAMLPLWEGYDEWAHFAVVSGMATRGELLVSRHAPIPRDVEVSLRLAPVPWELRSLAPPAVTRDEYWGLSPDERERRESALRTMPAAWGREDGTGAFTAYEALQPPLYYWTMAPALWVCRALGAGLMAQVLTLRFFSSLVASLAAPLVFLLARQVWGDGRLALGSAAIAAVMPGLALDVARVANDCLAVILFTLLTWLAVKTVQEGLSVKLAIATGTALGLGLLTKAYFLTAIPAMLAVWVYGGWKARRAGRAIGAASIGVLLAGWWYVYNLRTTGTLSGLSESVMLRGMGAGEMARQAAGIGWAKAIDAIFFSHLYFGGWSSLTVRSWMYHLFYVAILAAAVGLVPLLRRPAILTLLLVYLCFWLGQLYNVALLYISKGLAGSMGWYMYAVVGAEVTLCMAGLRSLIPARASGWIAAAGAAMFALLDLYTVHAVAIPYYTGMIRHKANGSLGALHWAGFQSVGIGGAVSRLAVFVPVAALVGLWLLYLLGTAGALACAGARKCDSAAKSQV
jgi:4-amino-4-deoxy-L-arabinose transferase-like glycosyltransferase